MYNPNRDTRLTRGDSPLEFATKGELMDALTRLKAASAEEAPGLEAEVRRLEGALYAELDRQVAEYEEPKRRDA